jgi:pimeloyl-ACP methyl ester carboxylesterase
VTHNTGRLRTAILGPLAVAATVALAAALSGCSSATSGQPAAAHAAAQSGCSLNPSPPPGFTEQKTSAGGIGINYVRGGHGPTLLLVAGYPQTWYAWDDILPELAKHYTVVAPDLPGSGGSDAPAGTAAYSKKAMAGDLYQLLAKLGLDKNVRVVGHDIGTMVAYSYAAAHPMDVTRLVLSEAPIPDQSIYSYPALTAKGPGLWWFGLFNEPDGLAENLMAGKAKVWVTQSMPTLEVVKGALTQCDLAIYTRNLEQPGHMQATINWFATFPQDIKNDAAYQKTKLTMPVMAIGASNSLGSSVPNQVRRYAANVTSVVFPDSGHWIYEEHPAQSAKLLLGFLG